MHCPQPTGTLIPDVWYLVLGILFEPLSLGNNNDSENSGVTQDATSLAKENPVLRDLLALSGTCSWFRTLLAPRLFRSIRLHNTRKSALAVQAIGEGKSSSYVKDLQYIPLYTGIWNDDEVPSVEEIYPPELNTVLSNLSCFNSLERFKITFVFDGDRELWDLLSDEFTDDFNSDAGVAEERAEFEPWRELMASSFRAIASNYDPQRYPNDGNTNLPLTITIRDLPPITLPTYYEPVWGHFLSHIKHFTMTIPYLENGAGWCLVTQSSYSGFAEYLGPWFFGHLRSVESISFDPAETGLLGDTGDRYDFSIGLHDAKMPNLRRVHLTNLALCDELLKFLIRHVETLESITLRDCHAFRRTYFEEGELRWKHLFKALIAAAPAKLREFEVVDTDQHDKPRLLFLDNHWADKSVVERAERKLKSEPDVRPFHYAYMSDKYGFVGGDFETLVDCFLSGEDDRLFKELMAVVEGNSEVDLLKEE
ncbi:hypothetical protein BJX64DRAFT_124553 [Aspergillus heterothallicus]